MLTEPFGHISQRTHNKEDTMFTKTALGLAVILATASGALAATKSRNVASGHDVYSVYNPSGAYVGTDPDLNIRFELNRDWAHGRY
jgi:hypothetical protein